VQTGQYEAVEALMELLREIQGRAFGLPQLLDPSDWLSDIYIDIVERSLLRGAFHVWRFNDDFRVATRSYSQALAAIEALDQAAREVGLILSEIKTTTPLFATYVSEVLDADPDTLLAEEDLDTGETVAVTPDEYSDLDRMDPGKALALVAAADIPRRGRGRTSRDIRQLKRDDVREIRRAWHTLTWATDDQALPHIRRFFSYVPSLTPTLCRYLNQVSLRQPEPVAEVLHDVSETASLSAWQAMWLTRVAHVVLEPLGERTQGVEEHLVTAAVVRLQSTSRSAAVTAEATVALSKAGLLSLAEIAARQIEAPDVLAPWYVSAAETAARLEGTRDSQRRLAALLQANPLFSWMTVQ